MKKARLEVAAAGIGVMAVLFAPLAFLAVLFVWALFHDGDPGPFISGSTDGPRAGVVAAFGLVFGFICGWEAKRLAEDPSRPARRRSFWWCGLLASSIVWGSGLIIAILSVTSSAADVRGSVLLFVSTSLFALTSVTGAFLRERTR